MSETEAGAASGLMNTAKQADGALGLTALTTQSRRPRYPGRGRVGCAARASAATNAAGSAALAASKLAVSGTVRDRAEHAERPAPLAFAEEGDRDRRRVFSPIPPSA